MITFIVAIIVLILGYLIYGKIVDKIFGSSDSNETPANTMEDGVDYIPMSWPKIFLIQFLNIAGLGPIYGAIAGALWGPLAFVWIVLGSIFAGGVHDFFSGMMSIRHNGASVSELVGKYLGKKVRMVMRVFSVVLLILVGVVFVMGPAGLLEALTNINHGWWIWLIIIYYVAATLLPIDKIIGKIYPIFGAALIFMAIGIAISLMVHNGTYHMPELTFKNLHPSHTPVFPFLFITIACGAISGFHATQSPLMARCVRKESEGRRIFYGSMIAEGVIALVWAAASMSFFHGTVGLSHVSANPSVVVHDISTGLLGSVGGILAILGVVACPITSGDTAFRSARLTIADSLNFKQGPAINRLMIAIPLFAVGIALTFIDFQTVWRYFAWANQTLAMIFLWAAAMYLAVKGKLYWIAAIPATFMTAVTVAYICQAQLGFNIASHLSNIIGVIVAVLFLGLFIYKVQTKKEKLA